MVGYQLHNFHNVYEMCSFIFLRGLDNKVTVYPLSLEEDVSTKKKTVGTHTSYMSCCTFPNSDQQVCAIQKQDARMWTGFICPRIGISDRLLLTNWMTVSFSRMTLLQELFDLYSNKTGNAVTQAVSANFSLWMPGQSVGFVVENLTWNRFSSEHFGFCHQLSHQCCAQMCSLLFRSVIVLLPNML